MKKMTIAEAQADLGRIVREVASTGLPVLIVGESGEEVVILTRGKSPSSEREKVLAALREKGLLGEPTGEELKAVEEFERRFSPEEERKILEEARSLKLRPFLSEIIVRDRGRRW